MPVPWAEATQMRLEAGAAGWAEPGSARYLARNGSESKSVTVVCDVPRR